MPMTMPWFRTKIVDPHSLMVGTTMRSLPSLDFRRRQRKLVQSNRCKTGPGKAAAGRPVASVA